MDALLTIHTMRAEHATARSLGDEVMALVTRGVGNSCGSGSGRWSGVSCGTGT